MDKIILLIESSNYLGRTIKHKLEKRIEYRVLWFKNRKEVEEKSINYSDIDIALIDFNLPGNDSSEILNICYKNNISTILIAEQITNDIQEQIWTKKVIDYILKSQADFVDNIVVSLDRVFSNHEIVILIVDSSLESREHLKEILRPQRYSIIEANNNNEAMKLLNSNENIWLVITDHITPELDGLKLTRDIRKRYCLDRLAIIGVSGQGNHSLKIQFIKSGANDFINKPFISELLHCRITQTLKIVNYFKKLKEQALFDHLTKLNNRHYLQQTGPLLLDNTKRNGIFIVTAMIDIDNFKLVNDTYGHDSGDIVLKEVAYILKTSIRKSDLAIRYGGEEFVIIGINMNPKNAITFFDRIREQISNKQIILKGLSVTITVSIGLCIERLETIGEMINIADIKMYEAKTSGKNRVCV